jgi:hypothetical protein
MSDMGRSRHVDCWYDVPMLFDTVYSNGNIAGCRDSCITDKPFALDYVEKRAGSFSLKYTIQDTVNKELVKFTPGPYKTSWSLGANWRLHLWFRIQTKSVFNECVLTLIDINRCQARITLSSSYFLCSWNEIDISLGQFEAECGFDYDNICVFQFAGSFNYGDEIWFDGVYFWDPDGGAEIGITDKSIAQYVSEESASRSQRVREAFEYASKHSAKGLLNGYFARLWLNQDIDRVNHELLHIFTTDEQQTKDLYGIDGYWSLFLNSALYRLYFWFGAKSRRMPGRLKPKTEQALLDLLWHRLEHMNDIHLANESTWWLVGSENHDINLKVSNLLSSQIFMHEPEYATRVYPDLGQGGGWGYWFDHMPERKGVIGPKGRANPRYGKKYTAKEHYEAWVRFWLEYLVERARKGFFVEVAAPGYMKYTVTFLNDIYDYCEDPTLAEHARMFLDLLWADWAQDQLSGRRGGAKTRCHSEGRNGFDAMYDMVLFLLGGSGNATHAWYSQLLSDYRLPKVIWELILDREGLGSYAYVSRKPGEEPGIMPRPLGTERTLMCDADSRLVRYSWVTPDYILGTQMDHPAAIHSHLSPAGRWQGITFSALPHAMVFPRAVDLSNSENWKMVEHTYRSVQHENVLITQQSRGWFQVDPEWFPMKNMDSMPFGVYFADMLEYCEEENGWIFARCGNAYVAVKVVIGNYVWNKQHTIIVCEDRFSPIIFEAGRRTDFPDFGDFVAAVCSNRLEVKDTVVPQWYTVTYKGCGANAKEIYFNAANNEIPMIDRQNIDYAPKKTFDSPFLSGWYGRGVITVNKGKETLVLDFESHS